MKRVSRNLELPGAKLVCGGLFSDSEAMSASSSQQGGANELHMVMKIQPGKDLKIKERFLSLDDVVAKVFFDVCAEVEPGTGGIGLSLEPQGGLLGWI